MIVVVGVLCTFMIERFLFIISVIYGARYDKLAYASLALF